MKADYERDDGMKKTVTLTGRVTFCDGMRLEITIGKPPKPDAKLYIDGNPLGLKESDEVIVALARRDEP
jgi:hypothetical protein